MHSPLWPVDARVISQQSAVADCIGVQDRRELVFDDLGTHVAEIRTH
jgi:hypothetical protein